MACNNGNGIGEEGGEGKRVERGGGRRGEEGGEWEKRHDAIMLVTNLVHDC